MIGVRFNKAFAEHVLEAIKTGGDIKAPEGGWTVFDMIQVAGVLRFGILSHGPQVAAMTIPEELHSEHRELIEEQLESSIDAGIGFASVLAMQVADDEYDNGCEEECLCVVDNVEGKLTMKPIEGFKA